MKAFSKHLVRLFEHIFLMEQNVQKMPSWSLVSLAEHASLLMSDTPHPMTMYEFDNFDPNYTLDKHGITKDHPDAINLVIKDVRY